MYRMLTWRLPPSAVPQEDSLPVDAKTWTRLLKPVAEFAPATPPALCDLVHRCLAFLPENRPERASIVQAELEALVRELVTSPEESLEAYEWK
jgi:hypothetical protein